MRVDIKKEQDKIIFKFNIDKEDRHDPSEKYSFGNPKVVIKIPKIGEKDIHPDLLALSSILMCHPFVGEKLSIPFPVSDYFLQSVKQVLSRYKIEYNGEKEFIVPRESMKDSRPALAFSGGVDSTAALAIMPYNTIPIFMNRPMIKKSLYKSEAALNSCHLLNQIGYEVKVISCDLEYLRDPVGFPTDLSHAVPAILMADILNIDSIAFGTILESAFGTGHERYRDYGEGSHWRFYGTLFKAAGLPISLPVSGLSEVGTAIVCERDPLGYIGQSCIRGTWKKPCHNCWKCCRKELLNMARKMDDGNINLDNLFQSNEVKMKLKSIPISHENILEYSIKRIKDHEHQLIPILRKRVTRNGGDMSFFEKWFSPSLEFVPKKYRRKIKENILKYIEPMTVEDEDEIINWDMTKFLASDETKDNTAQINNFYINY